MLRILFFLVLVVAFPQFAAAKNYKIAELLNLAKENSANIKAADQQVLMQKHLANQQKYWSNPEISFNQNGQQNNYSLTQTIPFVTKLEKKYQIEAAEEKILTIKKENLTLLIQAEVFALAYDFQALRQKTELAQKRLKRLESVANYLSNIALNSPTKKAQAKITKDKINLIERDLIQYQNQARQTWNKLNIFLGLEEEPQNIELSWLEKFNRQKKESFLEAALENNLNLKEQKEALKKYQAELNFAKIEQMPDLSISATQQNSNSTSAQTKNSSGFGASLTIPLLNQNHEKIIASQSKIKAQQYEVEFLQSQLKRALINDFIELEMALRISQNFPRAEISKTILGLNSANEDFKRGVLDFITYIELDSQEYQTIETSIDSGVKAMKAYANLMIKIGNFILPQNDQ